MDVEVHIEAIVLHGFAPLDRYRIGDALAEELGRLVREQGLPPWMAAGAGELSVDGGMFAVEPGMRAGQIGVQIARAIYGGQPQ